jgi:phenylalanyl-tRNA synthetase alpha subunit
MDELEKLNKIADDVDKDLETVEDLNQLQQKKANYLGKKGPFAEIMAGMKNLTADAKKKLVWQLIRLSKQLKQCLKRKEQQLKMQLLQKS